MDQKNIDTVLEVMAEKVRDLEFELGLRQYEVDKCRGEMDRLIKENESLRASISNLAEQVAFFECELSKEEEDGIV